LRILSPCEYLSGFLSIYRQSGVAGQVVVDTSLSLKSRDYSHIISVKPLAIAATEKAQFTVKGMNLRQRGTRFCSVFLFNEILAFLVLIFFFFDV